MNKWIYPLDRLSILFHNDHLDLLSKETLLCQIAFVFNMNANIWEICHWNLFWHQKQNKRAGFHNQFCYAVEEEDSIVLVVWEWKQNLVSIVLRESLWNIILCKIQQQYRFKVLMNYFSMFIHRQLQKQKIILEPN